MVQYGMGISTHRDLIAWQKSMQLVEQVYKLSRPFPKEEIYGLTSQLRRAAVSVPANIAEGHGRATRKDYASFVAIAKGSLLETGTLLEIAQRLGYASADILEAPLALAGELERILSTLHKRLVD